eukprot:gene32713-3597_t
MSDYDFGAGDLVGGLLWSAALYYTSPLQILLLFLGEIDLTRPSDRVLRFLGNVAGLPVDNVDYSAPTVLRAITVSIAIAAGFLVAYVFEQTLGDATWSVATGLGTCAAGAVYEAGRPDRLSADEAVTLKSQWEDFAIFGDERLQRAGRCHESEVYKEFRAKYPKFRSEEAISDSTLRDMIRNYHPAAQRTPQGYYKNLSVLARVDAFTGETVGVDKIPVPSAASKPRREDFPMVRAWNFTAQVKLFPSTVAACWEVYKPESICFCVDVDSEGAAGGANTPPKLDVLKQCIYFYLNAKKKMSSKHRFALATLKVISIVGLPVFVVTFRDYLCFGDASDEIVARTQKLKPGPNHYGSFDLGSLPALFRVTAEEEAQRGNQVYASLEDLCDRMSQGAGHSAYIFEASTSKKLTNFLVWLLAHPNQRVAQHQLNSGPVDLKESTPGVATFVDVIRTAPAAPAAVSMAAYHQHSYSHPHGLSHQAAPMMGQVQPGVVAAQQMQAPPMAVQQQFIPSAPMTDPRPYVQSTPAPLYEPQPGLTLQVPAPNAMHEQMQYWQPQASIPQQQPQQQPPNMMAQQQPPQATTFMPQYQSLPLPVNLTNAVGRQYSLQNPMDTSSVIRSQQGMQASLNAAQQASSSPQHASPQPSAWIVAGGLPLWGSGAAVPSQASPTVEGSAPFAASAPPNIHRLDINKTNP